LRAGGSLGLAGLFAAAVVLMAPQSCLGEDVDGAAEYAVRCASCHGQNLQGGSASALNSGGFRAHWNASVLVEDLYDFVRTTMPKDRPGELTDDSYRAMTLFLAERNGLAITERDWSRARTMPLAFP
jgi:mono/diheme cytochrome c family protein